jgi:hypothetical protein
MPMRFINVVTWRRPISTPSRFNGSRGIRLPADGPLKMQVIRPTHDREIAELKRAGFVVNGAAAVDCPPCVTHEIRRTPLNQYLQRPEWRSIFSNSSGAR